MLIDLGNVQSKEELHLILKEGLQFPEFYGMNWDAFWDAVTTLVDMPDKLVLTGSENLRKNLPGDTSILEVIIEEYNNTGHKKIELR